MKYLKVYSAIITIVAILLIGGLFFYSKDSSNLSKDDALEIVLEYLDIDEDRITVTSISKDYEDKVYEIQLYDANYEYEIDVNYITGNIESIEKDAINNTYIEDSSSVTITQSDALEIALNTANLQETDVTITKNILGKDDGTTVYKIYFYTNTIYYEVYVDVNTGIVIKYVEDYVESDTTTSEYIGIDSAKEIVLEHAGLSQSDVVWHEAKLDVEYGTSIYELEFYYNSKKYEYEVNAITGSIIKYEIDRY